MAKRDRHFAERGLEVSPREPRLLMARALSEYEVGNPAQGEAYLDRLLEVIGLTTPGPTIETAYVAAVLPVFTRITHDISRFSEAEAAAEAVLADPTVTPLIAYLARSGLALMAFHRRDAAEAAVQYAAIGPSGSALILGMEYNQLLGLLSQTMGNLDKAAEHFEDALSFCRQPGYRVALAWTCCDYADTLLQRNEPGDREKAMSLLDESLAISSELGMRPLMERVLSRREILKA